MRFDFKSLSLLPASAIIVASLWGACPVFAQQEVDKVKDQAKTAEVTISGTAVVQDAGSLMLAGKRLYLWGIQNLANDQKCWLNESAWSCGEEATMALKHFVEGFFLKCQIKENLENKAAKVQCFRVRGEKEIDIAHYMVAQGWAMDDKSSSLGLYSDDENKARSSQKGIWTSRFQTPTDWNEGIQKFLNDGDASADPVITENGEEKELKNQKQTKPP